MEGLKKSQDLLFKRPYLWIITISITSLNFLITYDFQKIDSQYFYYYLVDILTTYLIIEFYALGIRVLNKKIPLNQDFIKRVAYQLTLHTLSVILFSVILNELFDYIFFEGERLSLSFVFYTKDTIVALVFVLFFHVIYFALFFMSNQENLESLKIVPEVKLKVTDAYATKFLHPKEVVVVYSLFGITYVVGSDQNKYTKVDNYSENDYQTIDNLQLLINSDNVLEIRGSAKFPREMKIQLGLSPISNELAIIPGYNFDFFGGETVKLEKTNGIDYLTLSGYKFKRLK